MAIIHSPNIVTSGLFLYWDAANIRSYSGSGSTWTDLSGQSNTGTLAGNPIFSSNNGGNFLFDGTGPAATAASLNLQQNFTIEVWLNQNILSVFSIIGQGPPAPNTGLHIRTSGNTSVLFGMYANDTTFSSVALTTGTWNHMVFTYNHSSPYTKGFYFNTVAQTGSGSSAAYAGSGAFRLGAVFDLGQYDGYANGRFSNIKVYNRILTAAEVKQNFNAVRGRFSI